MPKSSRISTVVGATARVSRGRSPSGTASAGVQVAESRRGPGRAGRRVSRGEGSASGAGGHRVQTLANPDVCGAGPTLPTDQVASTNSVRGNGVSGWASTAGTPRSQLTAPEAGPPPYSKDIRLRDPALHQATHRPPALPRPHHSGESKHHGQHMNQPTGHTRGGNTSNELDKYRSVTSGGRGSC
jgi:hypothetical protein